ncbi:MAG: 2-succinyl-6-hydroxy-2,4-cyclohexadiene-1-carboxylate synthase [Psychromonas sp.]|nr:2-succinyl-6-hydroxy-2,4-cyclohexadiene-1-carboxylate synthase [Psychromonas sp.]
MPLYSRQVGSPTNPTVVFLHGFLGNSNDWNTVIEPLKNFFYCILIDLPGHGKSAHIDIHINNGFTQCHQLITQCLDNLNVHSFHLIGYSLGGRIALDHTRTQTSKNILSLTLESSHIGLISQDEKKQRAINDQKWANKFTFNSIEETLNEWYKQDVFEDLNPLQKKILITEKLNNSGACLANALMAASLSEQQYALPFLLKSHLPILYLFGENDQKFKAISQHFIDIKNIEIHSFQGVGHNIHHAEPQQYSQIMNTFLTTKVT